MADTTRLSGEGTGDEGELAVERSVEDENYFLSIENNGQILGKFSGSIVKNEAGNEIYRDGTFTDPDGEIIYQGVLKNNSPHGQGKRTYFDGTTCEGEYKNGQIEGGGKLICSNGDIYEGEFNIGNKNGEGKITYTNGVTIKGNFSDGELDESTISSVDFGEDRGSYEINDDEIIYKFPGEISFKAQFESGPDGKTLKGEFDKETGWLTVDKDQGIHINKKGEFFRGKFEDDKKLPINGTLFGINGSTYKGEFRDGKKNGKGKFSYSGSDGLVIYEGEYRNDQMEGKGKFSSLDGQTNYEGEYRNDQMEGKGKLSSPDGDIYEGEFKEDKKNGQGKYTTFLGSAIYEGEFREDKKEGKGKYTSFNGDVYEGEFKEDEKSGQGKLIQVNGDIYEGEFRKDKEDGKGKNIYKNGVTIEGSFAIGTLKIISKVDFGEGRGSYEIEDDKMVYKLSGEELFEVPFDNGSIKGFVTYKDKDKKVPIEFDKTTGWFTLDKEKGICINSKGELFRGELDAKTKLPTKGILSRRNGITLEGVFNEEGLLTSGKITQANGDYECGKFDTDGKLRRNYEYYIKKTRKKGDIAEISGAGDSSEKRFILGNRGVRMYFCYDKDSHLIGQDILLDEPKTYGEGERAGQINFNKIGNTKKLSSIKFDKDDFSEGPVTYYSYNTNGKPGATVKVDYGKLNEILSKGEIKNENDFMKSGAIVVNPRAKTFKKAQKALRIVQELMFKNRSRGGAQGFDGGYSEEINLGILANLKDFKGLKRVRFQELRAGNEVYKSPTKFLESLGISAGNIGSIEEDFISVSVSIFAEDIGHEVTLVLDMKKIKKIAKEKGFDGINDSNETLFKCFDTSRLVIEDSFREVLDGLAKNTALVKDFVIQKGGSCWEQSTAATIAVAENKELMKKAKSININSPIFTSSYASFPKGKYARDVLSNPIAVAQLREQLDIAKNNEVDLGTGKNLMEHIINSVIIDSLKEFSKTEKLLEEYDKRVQSLREERLKNKDKESKDKDKEPEEEFEKLVKEERDKLSKEITVENKKTEKEEEEELKGLGETAKKDWKSLSNFLEKKFKKEYANTCKDLDAGIKYDPTIAKKTIDLARTIAKKLGDNTQEKKALEIAMTKIEKSNGAYVDYLKKSLENSTRILRRGLDNIEKLNERIKSLRTHLEKEVVVEKVEEELNTKKNDESYFAGVSAPVSDSVEKFTSSPLASTLRLTSTSSSTGDPSSKTPPNVPKNKTQEQRKVNI